MVEKPSKVKKNNAVHRDCLDVTNEFFSKCSDLKNHEIVLTDDVKLPDLMNCIEMMDGKNDVSVHQNSNHNISIDSLIKKGFFNNLKIHHILSIIDETFALYVSYLWGDQSETTVYTNILLHEPTKIIPDKALGVFCKAFSYLIPLTRAIMDASNVVEPGEFSFAIPSSMKPAGEWLDIKRMVQSVEREYLCKANKLQSTKSEEEKCYRAISERLLFIRLFIELLDVTIPPLELHSLKLKSAYFSPQLSLAVKFADILLPLLGKIIKDLKTSLIGCSAGNAWRDIIVPGINMCHLTGSIPKTCRSFSPYDAFKYLSDLVSVISNSIRTIQPTFFSFLECCETRAYGENPKFLNRLTFFRAYTQILLKPSYDFRVLGQYPLKPLLKESLIGGLSDPNEYRHLMECSLLASFMEEATECCLSMIHLYGFGWSCQLQNIPSLIEKWISLLDVSDKLDMQWGMSLNRKPNVSIRDIVQSHIEKLSTRFFELTFSLDLLNSHEYGSMFWFYNEAIVKTRKKTSNRIVSGIVSAGLGSAIIFGNRTAFADKNRKITEEERFANEKLRQRYWNLTNEMKFFEFEHSMCISVIYFNYALRRLGHLPDLEYGEHAEHQVYNIRTAIYKWLHNMGAGKAFENWKEETAMLYEWEINRIWEEAHNCLKDAEIKLTEYRCDSPLKEKLHEIIRYNMLMCQLMADQSNWERKLELVITHPMDKFPTLKFASFAKI